jgi:hypothetical protein
MAEWVKCQAYTEDRHDIWVNLDLVISISGHDNGSVLRCAVSQGDGELQLAVWDKPGDILSRVKTRA